MRSTVALSLSFLALTTCAALVPRAGSTVRVQAVNQMSGANGDAYFPTDGTPVDFGVAYEQSDLFDPITKSVNVNAWLFVGEFGGVTCDTIKNGGNEAHLQDPSETFQLFSNKLVNWGPGRGFFVNCTLENSPF
jgi:hypothetical protein